jgi:glutamyl-tRNA reductase
MIYCYGLNHKIADVERREEFASAWENSRTEMKSLPKKLGVPGLVIVSTCNRFEVYFESEDHFTREEFFGRLQSAWPLKQPDANHDFHYLYTGIDTINHLFEVTASLDSMVVGENQIVGQVKSAYQEASEQGITSPELNKLFHKSFSVAKRVKTETGISEGHVSVGSVAVLFANRIFGKLSDKNALLCGAGEMGELVLKYLNSAGQIGETHIVNRTWEKAKAMEDEGYGTAHPIDSLPELLETADIFITAISGQLDLLTLEFCKNLMKKRSHAPLLMMDLGVPRNLDKSLSDQDNVYLFNVDDLQALAQENSQVRESHIKKAEKIITSEAHDFFELSRDTEISPTIAKLSQKFEALRKRELSKTMKKLSHLTSEDKQAIENLSLGIVNKVLHDPILKLKTDDQSLGAELARMVHRIFSLEDEV